MIRFIIKSYSFRKILLLTVTLIIVAFISSKVFDLIWGTKASMPIINLNDVYKPPTTYDNITRINIKLVDLNKIAIEGNKRFYSLNNKKEYDFFDTLMISNPSDTFGITTKIFLKFEDSDKIDSLHITVSKSEDPKLFFKQIFYSTVHIEKLNKFSETHENFRIKPQELVSEALLYNNDSLIQLTLNIFNQRIYLMKLTDCGTTCKFFSEIALANGLPCRLVSLQGGDQIETGYHNSLGYPQHVVCEIYSSRLKKWYVIDPTYGLEFKLPGENINLNAVELNNHYTFNMDKHIIQDSILFTRRMSLERDYFKLYENIYFVKNKGKSISDRLLKLFYSSFDYHVLHYSNYYAPVRNGFYYFGIKSFMYFIIIILYINSVIIILTKRLFQVKKPRNVVK